MPYLAMPRLAMPYLAMPGLPMPQCPMPGLPMPRFLCQFRPYAPVGYNREYEWMKIAFNFTVDAPLHYPNATVNLAKYH